MGVVFLILYIAIIIAVVGFLLFLFFKYFDIHPGKVADVFYKIPKSKEAAEKLKVMLEKLKIADHFKSLVESFKSSMDERKQRRSEKAALRETAKGDARIQDERLKVAYSNASNSFVNESVKTGNYQMKNEFLEKLNAKKTGTDEQFVEQQKVLNYQSANSKPNTAYNNMADTMNGILPKIVPSNYKTTRPIIAEKEPVLQEPAIQQTPVMKQTPVVQQTPVIKQAPVVQQMPIMKQAPVVQQAPIMKQTPVTQQAPVKQQTLVEKLASEKVKQERAVQNAMKKDTAKLSKKKKKYEIVQTGYASIFFSKSHNVIIIPYARDIEGKGRAMDGIVYLKYPIMPDELGKAILESIYIGDDIDAYTDKELIKKLEVKGWEDFTFQKKHISIKLDKACGYILNSTSRNPDGTYRINCPGGIEKVVRRDAGGEEIGDTVLNLLERCRV